VALFDAIVVGMGPAGSTAAHALASGGLRVLGLDKAKFPRYKSCGGCISTKVERELGIDLSQVIEDTVSGATFTYRSRRATDIISDRPVGHNVMRDTFDYFLLKRAEAAGCEVVEGVRVTGVSDDGASVAVSCANGKIYRASFVVGADGASGFVGRDYFGLNPKECSVSVTAEVPYDRGANSAVTGRLFIDFGCVPFGYGWIFPKKKTLSVGIAGDYARAGAGIKGYFNAFASSHEVLKGLRLEGVAGWTVPLFVDDSTPLVKGRVALVGDTGHLVDPFLGEGIYYAVKTARAAASAIMDCAASGASGLGAYQSWLEREIYPEFRAAEKLSSLVYNHPRLWYGMLEKDPEIMHRFYNVIRGEEDCAGFYKWVHSTVRSRPWKVLRRWIESRLIPQ
jgi:geranylgeranyl reductase family protein